MYLSHFHSWGRSSTKAWYLRSQQKFIFDFSPYDYKCLLKYSVSYFIYSNCQYLWKHSYIHSQYKQNFDNYENIIEIDFEMDKSVSYLSLLIRFNQGIYGFMIQKYLHFVRIYFVSTFSISLHYCIYDFV